jgi:hypothetical protein
MTASAARWQTWYRRMLRGALCAYWVVLFIATHIPKIPKALDFNISDKGLHSGSYTLLSFLLAACWGNERSLTWRAAAGLLGLVAAYGALDELLQIPVGRHADILDWRADLLGGLTGIGVYALGAWIVTRLKKPAAPIGES